MQVQQPRTSKRIRGSAMMVALGLIAATSAQAAPIQINATENSADPGSFTLDFGTGDSGITSGQITSTDYGLEVDPETGMAHLTNYLQDVQSLTIFGVDTGDIQVKILQDSAAEPAEYNEETREFTTTETYLVFFSNPKLGELFGLVSPVELVSTSTGTVDFSTEPGASRVNLTWEGTSGILGPVFSYICQVNTSFTATTTQIVNLSLKSAVLQLHLNQSVEDQLIGPLDTTALRLRQRNIGSAARNLQVFIDRVEGFSGGVISVFDANAILADARFVYNKIRPRFRMRK